MLETQLKLLLIEDEDDHFELIRRHLRDSAGASISLRRVGRLDDAISELSRDQTFDAVLTDLNLPDSRGVNTFRLVREVANGTPLIALTSQSVAADGVDLMREGAHDFLPKGSLDGELLLRSILCAVERRRLTDAELRLREQTGQMEIARQIQQSILPDTLPDWPELTIAAASVPADAVGGDYYDAVQLPNGDYLIVIGDATGHGPGAALVMAMAAASLRTLIAIYTDLGEILRRLNDLLVSETPSFTFMTFCLLKLSPKSNRLTWTNAGHPAPVVITPDSSTIKLITTDGHLPPGMVEGINYSESSLSLAPNSIIYAVTDGVTEALTSEDDVYGQQRLDTLVLNVVDRPVEAILRLIQKDVSDWRGDRVADDDETAWVLRWKANT